MSAYAAGRRWADFEFFMSSECDSPKALTWLYQHNDDTCTTYFYCIFYNERWYTLSLRFSALHGSWLHWVLFQLRTKSDYNLLICSESTLYSIIDVCGKSLSSIWSHRHRTIKANTYCLKILNLVSLIISSFRPSYGFKKVGKVWPHYYLSIPCIGEHGL